MLARQTIAKFGLGGRFGRPPPRKAGFWIRRNVPSYFDEPFFFRQFDQKFFQCAPAVEHQPGRAAQPASLRRGGSFQHLVLEYHAFRIVLLEPLFRRIHTGEHLDVVLSPICLLVLT
jgi:hypothetical protein